MLGCGEGYQPSQLMFKCNHYLRPTFYSLINGTHGCTVCLPVSEWDVDKAFDKTRGITVISPISPVIEPLATSDVLSRRRPSHKMSNSSNAPERDGKGTPIDADDSGDEDVFHDAHFPAEEEAVSCTGDQAHDRSSMLTSPLR